MQDCIGVTYTATQSILELFKLEVDYSSTLFQQKVQDCIGVTYTATQSTPEVNYSSTSFHQKRGCIGEVNYSSLFIFVSAKVQDCIGVTYTATQSTLQNYLS